MAQQKETAGKVPKLQLGSIPLIPGFKSHRDVSMLQPWHGKRTIACTERIERQGAQANMVSHSFGPYSARPETARSNLSSSSSSSSSNNNNNSSNFGAIAARKPSSPHTPRRGAGPRAANQQRTKWLRFDRETLRFYMFFQEAVSESPLEQFRVRKVVLLYYRSDDTIQVSEPREVNSGLNQGSFLRKVPISSLIGLGGKPSLELTDLVVGCEIPLFGRIFKIVDADTKTRRFFAEELGIQLAPAEPYPEDSLARREQHQAVLSAQARATIAALTALSKPKDTLRKFLDYGQKSLLFDAMWDDSNSLYGDKRFFKVHFFLSDETVQIKEMYKANCGREPFPKFLSRASVHKADGSPLGPEDFLCGSSVTINGRDLLLLDCDPFTRDFYAKRGVEQCTVEIKEEKKPLPRMPEPPYNGFGSEEDSLGSFYNLVPKAPRKNFERQKLYEDQCMHIRVELVTDHPEEADRTFDLSFHLADESMALFEPKKRNSGVTGGKFLERGSYINPLTGKAYTIADVRSRVEAWVRGKLNLAVDPGADTFEILKRKFRVYNADDFALSFFDLERPAAPLRELGPVDRVFQYIVNQLLQRKLNIREMFKKADRDNSRSIQADEFKNMLADAGMEISEGDLALAMSKFNSGRNEIWYQEFCDALSRHWTPPVRDSTSRIEEIQALLLRKFRDSNTQLRVLFRNFDKDKNGNLTFSEFKRLLKHYTIDVSDEELAGLMSLYDKEQEGSINYNEFCDTVYECDFSSVLDKQKTTHSAEVAEAIQVGDYLAKIQSRERSLEEQDTSDVLLRSFVERIGQRSQELSAVFRSKMRDAGIGQRSNCLTPDQFLEVVSHFTVLHGNEKDLFLRLFFPSGANELTFERFNEVVSKATVRKE